MGEVYRANDTELGREVAIKVLPAELSSKPNRLGEFEQEARAASALHHPNIVTVYEIGEHDGAPFVAMELVEGPTLREKLADGPLTPDELVPYATQMADALSKAHGAGIVHRNLKPDNIIISNDGHVKIFDFGLAKLQKDGEVQSEQSTPARGTSARTILGAVSYLSPEQAKGQPTDFRSDQFALGAIFYECATARPPFRRASVAETLSALLHDDPKPVDNVLGRVIQRCLSKEPFGRFGSTEDLLAEIERSQRSG
jgi:serine/threonine protein kinase